MTGGEPPPPAAGGWTDGVVRRVLPNGTTILTQHDPSAPVVSIVIHVRAGYFDEPDEWTGISHVLEHMYFKGTGRSGPGDLARTIRKLGGYTNAGTIYDATSYYSVLPSDGNSWKRAFELQADSLMNCLIDPEELDKEIRVIIQEANRKLDNASAVTVENLFGLLYPDHPMGRWRIGTEEQLGRLTAADVRAYYKSRYVPRNVIVTIVGDLDARTASDFASGIFCDWASTDPDGVMPPPSKWVPSPGSSVSSGDVNRAICAIGWKTVPETDRSSVYLDVAASVLASGRSSRLYRSVRVPGFATSVSATHYTPTYTGTFYSMFQGPPENVSRAAGRVLGAVDGLIRGSVTDDELARAIAIQTTRRARALESMEGRASALAHYEALGGYSLADDYWMRMSAASPTRVRETAARFLEPDRACLSAYVPATTEPSVPWPLAPDPEASGPLPVSKLPAKHDGEKQGQAPVPTLFRNRGGSDIVTLGLYVSDLQLSEPPDRSGATTLFVRSAIRGAGGLNAEMLNSAAESLGGAITATSMRELTGWSMTVPATHAADAGDLLLAVALDPVLDLEEVGREKEQMVTDALRARDDSFGYPVRRALEIAFAGGPYGQPLGGTPESLAAIAGADVNDRAAGISRCRSVLVAAGAAVTAADLELAWPGGGDTPRPPDTGWNAEHEVERREREQTAIAMAFPGVSLTHDGASAVRILCASLGGMGGRLFRVLREERSLGYTVAATPFLRKHCGALLTYIACAPGREDEARIGMLEELQRVADDGVKPEDLETARSYLIGQEKLKLQSSAAMLSETAVYWACGVPGRENEVIERLAAVSGRELQEIAARLLAADARSEFVLRAVSGS